MSTTLENSVITITAPKSVIPDLASPRQDLAKIGDFFHAAAGGMNPGKSGETRISLLRGSSSVQDVQAYGTVTLLNCAALTGVKINNVVFTALATGTPTVAFNQFVISGTDAADATSLAAAINASTTAGIAGVVQAGNLATTIQLTTVLVGQYIDIDGTRLTGVNSSPDRKNVFSIDTSDTAAAAALAAAINAHPTLRHKFLATSSTDTVTLRQKTGTTGLGLQASAATFTLGASAPAAVSTVLVTAKQAGVIGNNIKMELMGIQSSTTATCVSVVITDTLIVNGQTLTGIKQRASGTLTAASAVAGDTCVVAGVTFTGVAGATGVGKPVNFSIDTSDDATGIDLAAQINAHPTVSLSVTATNLSGVVTIRAVDAGTAGNAIVMAGTAVRLAFVGGTLLLSGGIAVANNQFDVSPGATNTQVAADIVRCINASTTTLISDYVRATNLLGVVTVYSKIPGLVGNGITLSSTGGTITCAAARLAGATIAALEGAQATGTLSPVSWANTNTVIVNGVTITAHTSTQANDQVDISGADSADAANLALAINNSTTAGLAPVVATSSSGVVTVTARKGGTAGNLIALVGHANCAASVTRLATGAVPTTVVLSGDYFSGGVGGDAATVNTFVG